MTRGPIVVWNLRSVLATTAGRVCQQGQREDAKKSKGAHGDKTVQYNTDSHKKNVQEDNQRARVQRREELTLSREERGSACGRTMKGVACARHPHGGSASYDEGPSALDRQGPHFASS